ncbi:MAG: VOC family protein [Sphingomonadales bacterium CG12_big_fil_rev_8_21_14_0_65_65_10]|nr:MAG: VOC family protein [Sphingomonadales bacterium CG12_big_fil_rev_8_21_14_0_65_65_10]
MNDKHGDFIWYELLTGDAEGAKSFYGPLLGWKFARADMPEMEYHLITKDGVEVGGIMPLTAEMTAGGAQPMWAGYVAVDDVDKAAEQATAKGASVLMAPSDIPDVGRFAMIMDPQGVPIYLMTSDGALSESFAKHEPREGHCAWNELVTADPTAAKAFYTDLFGWEKVDEMDMGEMGLYEMFSVNGYTLGAIMKKPDMMPFSAWVYYLRVPEIDAAAEYVTAHGGQIMTGPMEIPGGEFIINGTDPQGAFFALIGKKGS